MEAIFTARLFVYRGVFAHAQHVAIVTAPNPSAPAKAQASGAAR